MLVLAGDDAGAIFVVADSPKMMLAWCVPMASRRSPLSWMALTTLTSLGYQRRKGAPKVVSAAVVALVLEGLWGVSGGWELVSGVVGCLTVACRCFLGVSGGGGGGGGYLQGGGWVDVVGGGGSGPCSSGR